MGIINEVYFERNIIIALLTTVLPTGSSHICIDPEGERGWQHYVCVDLPMGYGQCTWHIPDDELVYFKHLPKTDEQLWDGHNTAEKYRRVTEYLAAVGLSYPHHGDII